MKLVGSGDPNPIRFGTRGSALARAQTDFAIGQLRSVYPDADVVIVVIRTEGDIDKISPLTDIGGRGVFTSALEMAIIGGEIDAAVHSAKDLPTVLHVDAPIVAYPSREDPRDALVSRHGTTLDFLPDNPVIGTSSRRREAQVLRLRPDARVMNIRGNIDSRLRKAESPEFDGVILAAAGLIRMGWADQISEYFAIEQFVPSPGQGAIAIQACRSLPPAEILASIDDCDVAIAVGIERSFLAAIGAGCTMPVGAYASPTNGGYRLDAMLGDAPGSRIVFASEELDRGREHQHAADVAWRLAREVDGHTSQRSWNGLARSGDLTGARVIVTRPRHQAGQLMQALGERGAQTMLLPTTQIETVADTSALDAALAAAARGEFDWIAFTSANAVSVVANRMDALDISPGLLNSVKVAAVGEATARAARDAGLTVELVPSTATGAGLTSEMLDHVVPGTRILYPRSAIGRDELTSTLRPAGVEVVAIDAYRTIPEQSVDPVVLGQVAHGGADAIVFASPSSIHGLIEILGVDRSALKSCPAVCAGPVTADAAREAGLTVAAISADPGAQAISEAVAEFWACRVSSLSATPAPKPEDSLSSTGRRAE
jgi:hydroxymethylbilane synthase